MKLVAYIDVVFKLKFTNGKSPMLPALLHLVLFSFSLLWLRMVGRRQNGLFQIYMVVALVFLQVFGCWLNWNLFATASLRRKGEVFSGKIHCKKTI